MPIISFSILDKEFTGSYLTGKPELYIETRLGLLFNKRTFWYWMALAAIQSLMISFFTWYILDNPFLNTSGNMDFIYASGNFIYLFIVITVNFKILIIINNHSGFSMFSIFGSIILYIFCFFIVSTFFPNEDDYNTFQM